MKLANTGLYSISDPYSIYTDYLYSTWIKENEPKEDDLIAQAKTKFKHEPKISIVVSVYNVPKEFLTDMIESVLNQTYSNWELCIVDGNSKEKYVKEILDSYLSKDKRIKVKYLENNKGIAGNLDEAIDLSTGEYIAFLNQDDTLAPFALYEVVKAINENEDVDLIYSDEDKITDNAIRLDPFFKPDFNLDMLRSYNYIAHLLVIKRELLNKVGNQLIKTNILVQNLDTEDLRKHLLQSSNLQSLTIVELTFRMKNGFGVDLVVTQQAKYFLSKGYNVVIICFEHEKEYVEKQFHEYLGSQKFHVYQIDSLQDAIDKLSAIQYHILIAHTPPFFSLFKIIKTNALKIFFDHGEPPPHLFPDKRDRELQNIEKYDSAKFADLSISISNFIKHESGIEHSVVLWNGNDHLLYKEGDRKSFRLTYGLDNCFIVLNVTRFYKYERMYKGVDLYAKVQQRLFEKYPELKTKIVFVLIGRGNEEDIAWCKENGLIVCPNMSNEMLINAYKESNLYLSMSQWEGYNLGIGQALSFGLDTIASDTGAHSEFGIFVSNNIDELADYIAKSYERQFVNLQNYKNPIIFPWHDNLIKFEKIILKSLMEKLLNDAVLLFYKDNKHHIITKVYNDASDYDLILKCIERARNIVHIPKILYHIRLINLPNSLAESFYMKYSMEFLQNHLSRMKLDATIINSPYSNIFNKIIYTITRNYKISIIIPNKDHKEDLKKCITSIINKSTYKNYEIIIVENNSKEKKTFEYYEYLQNKYNNIVLLEWKDKFNYSAVNNFASKYANGDILLFLNNDTEVINENWIEEMLMYAQRKDVGAVGAKLYYPDDTIQHGGVILGIGGIAGHSHRLFPRASFGYFGRLVVVQNLSAVTGACLMMRKDVFNEVEGFDEGYSVAFNDVDICVKVREKGYLVVWTPYAELYHHESKTRGYEDTPEKQERFKKEIELFKKKWGHILEKGDPYYNPNLTLDREDFSSELPHLEGAASCFNA
ncbi:MAG: glycosyltransferase [Candidatus Nanopusillus acidilobi]